MRKNLAGWDRGLRVFAAIVLAGVALAGPLTTTWRLVLGGKAVYLLLSALVGTCLGYRLMGRSTCPVRSVT